MTRPLKRDTDRRRINDGGRRIRNLERRFVAGGLGASVLASLDSPTTLDINAASTYTVRWDAIYNNSTDFSALGALPDDLGLDFAFDGSDGTITTTEDGLWAFTYEVEFQADATVAGFFQLDICGISRTNFGPGIPGANFVYGGADVIVIPSGTNFHLLIDVTAAATSSPYYVTAAMAIARIF